MYKNFWPMNPPYNHTGALNVVPLLSVDPVKGPYRSRKRKTVSSIPRAVSFEALGLTFPPKNDEKST